MESEIKISWTIEAKITYFAILDYLQAKWSNKEVKKFVEKTQKILEQISKNPKMFKHSKNKDIHIGLITKQNSLIYKVTSKEIVLLTFWDNRQNPTKLKY